MKNIAAALGILVGLSTALPTFAASTINPSLPALGLPYNAAPIQQNFGAAANDINAIDTLNAGPSPPANPALGTPWLNTPQNTRIYPLEIWDGPGAAWLTIGSLDSQNNVWIPAVGGGVLPNILSAVTTDLGSVPQAVLNITGNNTIQSFGSLAPPGSIKVGIFGGTATLTGSSALILPTTATSIAQQAGDVVIAVALGSGNWQVIFDSRLLQSCSGNGNFSCTAVNVQTGPYTAASADCSNIIQLSGNAYYTLSVGLVSTYTANCQLTVQNIDAGRSKLVNISGGSSQVVFPGQRLVLTAGGGTWNYPEQPRWRIQANTTFFVDPVNGQDPQVEDCLALLTGACQSIQAALDLVTRHVDFNNFVVTIQLAPDTTPGHYKRFALNGSLVGIAEGDVGASSGQPTGNLIISGATNSASNYLIDGQGANSCVKVSLTATLTLQNLTLQNCNRLINEFGTATAVFINNVSFGSCALGPFTPAQMFIGRLGYLEAVGSYQIIGSANCAEHYDLLGEGIFWADATNTGPILATITANLSYSTAFARPFLQSAMNFRGYTSSPYVLGGNTVTGAPYQIQGSSSIELGPASSTPPTFFSGSSTTEKYDFSTPKANKHNNPPTLNSCGGGSPSLRTRSTDYSGIVAEGTSVTSCTMTFSSNFAQNPICQITAVGTPLPTTLNFTATQTKLTISHDSASGATISYRCTGG